MDKKMNFKYFYGTEADQFSFYRIPKAKEEIQKFKKRTSMRERKGGRYMDKKMNFKYFYGTEADQFSFYRIPKAL